MPGSLYVLVLATVPEWARDPSILDGAAATVIYADASSGVAGQWEAIDRRVITVAGRGQLVGLAQIFQLFH